MKRIIVFILVFIFASSFAYAEEYANMSLDELETFRDTLVDELALVNAAIASKKNESIVQADVVNEAKIKDLFPDEDFALYIRDELGKMSINDVVTQDELDSITRVHATYDGNIVDLTGISHLRNLSSLSITPYKATSISNELLNLPYLKSLDLSYFNGTELPDWLTQMVQLEYLWFPGSSLVTLPDDIGALVNLKNIMLNNSTDLISIPESIGQCTALEELHLGNTGISTIPDSLGNCANLKNLEVGYTSISELPQSVLDLGIEKIDISHTNIK